MSLDWKVYSREVTRDLLVASCLYAEDAAGIAGNGENNLVKVDGRIVWHEGQEKFSALDSFDAFAKVVTYRRELNNYERAKAMRTTDGGNFAEFYGLTRPEPIEEDLANV